jgi:hypothetical protein
LATFKPQDGSAGPAAGSSTQGGSAGPAQWAVTQSINSDRIYESLWSFINFNINLNSKLILLN